MFFAKLTWRPRSLHDRTFDINLKDLGSVQQKVLFFLAENPDEHKQAIQQGLKYPSKQYSSVLKAVSALEKLGYVESRNETPDKNVKIKVYHCTEAGVLYVLCKNPYADFVRFLDAYKNLNPVFNSFRNLYDVWGHDAFVKFFKNVSDFFPMIQRDGFEQAAAFLMMKSLMDAKALDPKTNKRNAKAAMKQFPNTKRLLKKWKDNIKDVL